MGNPNSKLDQNQKDEEPEDASVPSTPIATPKIRTIENDPRSPSTNIARTPIQVEPDLGKVDTPVIGVIDTLGSESEDTNKDNLTMNFDPRSPSVEFTRTPIVVGGNVAGKLRNKNLDNVKKQLTDFSPLRKSQPESVSEVATPVKPVQGPILLEVTPITKKLEQQQKRKSYVGLLETNLDYVETNLDAVAMKLHSLNVTHDEDVAEEDEMRAEESGEGTREGTGNQRKIPVDMETDSECEQAREMEIARENANANVDEESVKIKEHSTESDEVSAITEGEEKEMPAVTESEEKEMPAITESEEKPEECERTNSAQTPEDALPADATQKCNISQTFIHKLEIISPIKETLEKISQIDREIKEVIAHNPISNFDESNPTRDFDKKVASLIYEDQQRQVVPKLNRLKDDQRSALTERNVNQHNRQMSVNRLRVSDKPLNKQEYAVSKIPVFKDKKSKSKALKQCENTPPRQKHVSDVKAKKTQWDADNTLII